MTRRHLLALGLAAPLLATPAHAAVVAGAVQTLSPVSTVADDPYVGLAADGTALATWTEDGKPRWALRPADGQWGFTRAVPGAGRADVVDFDEASDGSAVLAWTDLDKKRVMASVRPPGGRFAMAVPVGDPAPTAFESEVSVSVAPGGEAVVAWTSQDGSVTRIQAALHHVGAAGFTVTTLGSTTSTAVALGSPQAGIDQTGRALAVWDRTDSTDSAVGSVQYATAPAGGAFGPAGSLVPVEQGPARPRLAVSPDTGAALLAWRDDAGSGLIVSPGSVTGTFAAGQPLLGDGQTAYTYAPAIDPGGRAAVLASINDHGTAEVAAAVSDQTGTFPPVLTTLSAHDRVTGPGLEDDMLELSPAAPGEFFAVWENDHASTGHNQAWASSTSDGTFGAPTRLSPAAADVSEVFGTAGASGSTVATWTTFTRSTVAQATPATPDTVAPSLGGLKAGPARFNSGKQTWRLGFTPSEDVKVTVTVLKGSRTIASLARRVLADGGRAYGVTWKGTRKGKAVPDGRYTWKVSVVDAGGNQVTRTGSVTTR